MATLELLENQAIDAAISSNWDTAVLMNKEILKLAPSDMDACLRLGYAYLQLNDLKAAKKFYKEALKVQPKHNIALENLERIEVLQSKKKTTSVSTVKYDPNLFLEVPGKTRTITLVNLGQKEDVAGLRIGEELFLKEKKRRLEVRSHENEYIGSLPDDISKRLLYFIKEGSEYKTYIKDIDLTEVIVFVKEIMKGHKVRQYPSFPSNPHVMLTDINQIEEEGEEEEAGTEGKEEDPEDDDAEDLELEHEHWDEEIEEEGKEDLDHYVDVEEEEEEEEV
jgi:tetratricopeptide (TPR) repeat protein